MEQIIKLRRFFLVTANILLLLSFIKFTSYDWFISYGGEYQAEISYYIPYVTCIFLFFAALSKMFKIYREKESIEISIYKIQLLQFAIKMAFLLAAFISWFLINWKEEFLVIFNKTFEVYTAVLFVLYLFLMILKKSKRGGNVWGI